MNRKIILAVVAVVLVAAAFGAGYLVATKVGGSSSSNAQGRFQNGGPFAQLTDAERQELQNMTDAERQAFFKEKGIDVPQGMPAGGPDAATGGARGGTRLLEGKVAAVDSDKVTLTLTGGGSATVYLDQSTVKAAVSGASPVIAKDANVYVVAQQEAQGVTAAKVVVVR